jgi:hypothetical protein
MGDKETWLGFRITLATLTFLALDNFEGTCPFLRRCFGNMFAVKG